MIVVIRCYYSLGQNAESIEDARNAVAISSQSFLAREALGKALYSAGYFEHALVEFYKANRCHKMYFVKNKLGRNRNTIRI